jgi:hypothetical protein
MEIFLSVLDGKKEYPYPDDKYLGEVASGDFIDGVTLAANLGLTAGISQNATTSWLKFQAQEGYTFLIPKKSLRYRLSWDSLNTANVINGVKTVLVQGNLYKVRVLKGAEANPTGWTSALGQDNPAIANPSEWNRFVHRVSANNPGLASNWESFSNTDLGVANGTTIGRMSICTEEVAAMSGYVIGRGNTALSEFNYFTKLDGTSTAQNHYGWRPVLELIGPAPYYPDSGPGSKYLITGDEQLGYFGEVSAADLMTHIELRNHLNPAMVADIRVQSDLGWFKFYHKGKVKFIGKGSFSTYLSWNTLYANGGVYGTNDNGKYPASTPVNQYRPVTLVREGVDCKLVPRLITGGPDPYTSATAYHTDNEYGDLLYRMVTGAHPNAGLWASYTTTALRLNQAHTCVSTQDTNSANSMIRGYSGNLHAGAQNLSKADINGYSQHIRMVLELESIVRRPLLALDPSDQTAGSTVIEDKSGRALTVSNVGVVVSDDGPKPGVKSMYFDGTGWNYLRIPHAQVPNILRGDFTIEYWYKPQTNANGLSAVFNQWQQAAGLGGVVCSTASPTAQTCHFGPFNENGALITASAPPPGWVHEAITRKGDTFTRWRDGKSVGTALSATSRDKIAIDWTVGAYFGPAGTVPANGATVLNGWVAKLAITGYCKYTAEFTPE